MKEPTRRRFLRLSGAAFAAGLAGCTSSADSVNTRFGELRIENYDSRPHTVHVLFENSSPAYWATKRIPAPKEHDYETVYFEDLPAEPENGVLYIRLDDQPKSAWKEFDFGGSESGCLGLLVKIGSSETPTDTMHLWTRSDDRMCHDGQTTNRSNAN